MAEHIQRLISIQREMGRAVAHELRTPVARLRFGLQIIEDTADDAFTQKQVEGMDADISELDGLIDEILTYARLEEGGPLLNFQRVNIFQAEDGIRDADATGVQTCALPIFTLLRWKRHGPTCSRSTTWPTPSWWSWGFCPTRRRTKRSTITTS